MQRSDLIEVGELLAEGLDATAGMAEETHFAIAKRAFQIPGAAGRGVQTIHDAIAAGTYRVVRTGLRGGAKYGARAWANSIRSDAPALADRRGGAVALGALHGFVGDLLDARGSTLAPPMQLRAPAAPTIHATGDRSGTPRGSRGPRATGRELLPDADDLAAAYPQATGKIAVFLHGLCESELAWNGLPLSRAHEARPLPFPQRLEADAGYTPVLVRFNSGLHISSNGRQLDALLAGLVEQWPVEVTELTLIGHSMGGLIARSAAHQGGAREQALAGDGDAAAPNDPATNGPATSRGATSGPEIHELSPTGWTGRLRHVVCLGTPHLGADLERGVHLLAWALGKAPESRAFARMLWLRSDGIKDLRHGAALEEDWQGLDPDALLRRRYADVPFLPHADYCWISAQLTGGVAGHVLGDLLVRTPSASGVGKARSLPFEAENGRVVHGLTHFDLLDHPAVYDQLLSWLTRPRRLLPAAA